MSAGFTFSACSFFYSVLLTIMFFSKKRIQRLENKIYSYLIISNLIGVVLGVSCYTTILHRNEFPVLNDFVSKALLIYYLTWISFFTAYTFVISHNNKGLDNDAKEKYYDKILNILTIIYVVIAVLVFVLPLNYFSKGTIAYSFGPSANLLYILIPIYICVCLIQMFKNFKEIKNKKYLPLFAFIIIGTVVMIIQKLNPGLLLMTSMETFVTFLMFFTIENPDIKMIDELTKAKDLVEKNNNDKSIFIFNTSQQIKYPLNIIEQRVEQILDDDDINRIKENALDIKNAEEKISYILNRALNVSNIDAKKVKIVETQYSLSELLEKLSIKFRKEAEEKDLEFRVNCEESIPEHLYGDSIRLKQIITALLSNSIKYTENGFVEIDINSIISFDICRLVISIKDSGTGLKDEEIKKMFNEGNSNDNPDDIEKLDLTLENVKKMVNLIGGTITVRSEKNKGTEFNLILDQRIVRKNDSINNIIDEYKHLEKENILFVSDIEEDRVLYQKKLNGVGNISLSKSGEDCLKRIRNRETYDLIIIEEKMQKLDAYKTIDKLNKIEDRPKNIIVLVDKVEEMASLKSQGYKVLSKDMSDKIFIKTLKQILGSKK